MKYFLYLCLCVVSVERRVLAGYARFHLMLLCHDHRSAGHQATQPGHGGHGGQCGHHWTAQIITRILFSHTQTDHHQAHLHICYRLAGGSMDNIVLEHVVWCHGSAAAPQSLIL